MALRRGSAEARVLIEGEENVSKIVEDVKRKVATMADATRKNTEATKALREGWRMTATGISSVINLAQQAAQAAQAVGDALKEGARSNELNSRFMREYAGAIGGAAGALDSLKAASMGALDTSAVQEFAMRARRMGLDVEQMAKLLNLATKMSVEAGESVKESADKLLQAVNTGESGALRQIGILINLEQHIGQYAKSFGGSAEAMRPAIKAQLNYNEILRAGQQALGDVDAGGAIAEVNKLNAAWFEVESTLKGVLAAQVMAGLKGFREFTLSDMPTALAGLSEIIGLGDQMAVTYGKGNLPDALMRTSQETDGAVQSLRDLNNEVDRAIEAARMLKRAEEDHAKVLREMVTAEIESREITLQNTIAKAEYAQELGHLVLAEELFTQASQIATTTQDGEAEATRLATQAIVIKNRELIQLLNTQILLNEAELEFVPAAERPLLQSRIDVAKARLEEAMTPIEMRATPGFQAPTRGRPTRGGAARDDAAERIKAELAAFKEAKAAGAEAAAAAMKQEAVQSREMIDEAIRASQEKVKAQADAYKELMNAVTETSRQGLSDSISMMGQLGGEFEQLGFGVSNAASIVVSEVDRMNAAIRDFAEQGRSSGEAWEANAGAITSASGRIVAGMIKDTTSQAVVLSAFELAAGFASLGALNPVAATNHFIASALYAGVAGMSAAGGGASGGTGAGRGGRTAPRTASLGPAPARDEKKATAITINMSGAMVHGGNQQQFIRTLASEIQKETGAQQAPPDFMMG